MKHLFFILTIMSFVAPVYAANNTTVTCSNNEAGITLTIQEKGYDKNGRIFEGVISKEGETIRTTVLRRAFVSNYFALYAPGRGGWRANNDTENSRDLQINADTQALRKLIGYSVVVKCNKSVPRSWYEIN